MLAFDLETLGEDPLALDDETRAAIVKSARDQDEAVRRLDTLALRPWTAEIVCIAMVDTETGAQTVMANSMNVHDAGEGVAVLRYTDEAAMLRAFWKGASARTSWLTYNGRGFDAPFLALRSARYGIAVDRRLAAADRYRGAHYDLADVVTNFGALYPSPSLAMLCRMLGVPTPKDDIDGSQVGAAWRSGEHERVVRYCLKDVEATIACARAYGINLGEK